MAVIVFAPIDVKTTLQLPVPLERVIVQFVLAPVTVTTEPSGTANALFTVTTTVTELLGCDGLGSWLLIVKPVENRTAWALVALLVRWVASGL